MMVFKGITRAADSVGHILLLILVPNFQPDVYNNHYVITLVQLPGKTNQLQKFLLHLVNPCVLPVAS